MNRRQRRERGRGRRVRPSDPPAGYQLALRQVSEAYLEWIKEHPNAQLRFRLPGPDFGWIGPLDERNIDIIAMTEDARLLLEYMDKASGQQATIAMAAAVLKTLVNLSPTVTHELVPFVCPHCFARLNAVTDPTRQGHLPNPGSLSICDQCTELGIFCEDMTVRKFTPLEMQAIDPEQLAEIQAYRANLKASRGRPRS